MAAVDYEMCSNNRDKVRNFMWKLLAAFASVVGAILWVLWSSTSANESAVHNNEISIVEIKGKVQQTHESVQRIEQYLIPKEK